MAARKKTPEKKKATRRKAPATLIAAAAQQASAQQVLHAGGPVEVKLTPAQEIESLKGRLMYYGEENNRISRICGEQREVIRGMALIIGRGSRY